MSNQGRRLGDITSFARGLLPHALLVHGAELSRLPTLAILASEEDGTFLPVTEMLAGAAILSKLSTWVSMMDKVDICPSAVLASLDAPKIVTPSPSLISTGCARFPAATSEAETSSIGAEA